ncbi:MAG: NAD(P)-dependent oxidoreductase [Steroidobacteraceae bacterium]|nr:NAD(P)-dependent oxidoreductase [Steroidobacteraceae bacterium]
MKIGVIGLGTMGQPIAQRIARAGHEVLAWNRTPGRADSLPRDSAVAVRSAAEACQAELVLSVLSDDAAVEGVLFDGGRLITAGVPGLVHACLSTISDRLARKLAAAHEAAGQAYVSAPLFGPPDAAAAGRLLVVASGPRTAAERIRPVLELLGRVQYLGEDAASANVVKSAGNFLMAAVVESLRDATQVVHAAGVDPREFAGIVTQSLFPTPVYQYLGGLLAVRQHQGGVRVPNPFLRGAEQTAATAAALDVSAPLAAHVARQLSARAPSPTGQETPTPPMPQ